jgi:hypothetical protein
LSWLVEGVALPRGVIWGWSTLPPWMRGAQGWDSVVSVHCSPVSSFSLSLLWG